MPTNRRNLFYVVAFTSLQVALWGAVFSLRAWFSAEREGLPSSILFGLAGLLVFLPTWRALIRGPWRDLDERNSFQGAAFLHTVLLSTLLPGLFHGLALLNRILLAGFGLDVNQAAVGANQTNLQNGSAFALNWLAVGYFTFIRHGDWPTGQVGERFAFVRRIFRYLLLAFSLVVISFGFIEALLFAYFVLARPDSRLPQLANSLALLLVGMPVWWFSSQAIRRSLIDPGERASRLRLGWLLMISFFSQVDLVISTCLALTQVLGLLLGEIPLSTFLTAFGPPLAIGCVTAGLWLFYRDELKRSLKLQAEQQRRIAMRRWFEYTAMLTGLTLASYGAWRALHSLLTKGTWTLGLPLGISALIVGGLFWFVYWRQISAEAGREGDLAESPRLVQPRRVLLFFVLLVASAAAIISMEGLLSMVFGALPRGTGATPAPGAASQPELLIVSLLVIVFHSWVLFFDQQVLIELQRRRYAQFPVLILAMESGAEAENDQSRNFATEVAQNLHRLAPTLPVAVHPANMGVPDEILSAARVVVLPSDLLVRSPEAVRLWLQAFPGPRVVVPMPWRGWRWISAEGGRMSALARLAAEEVRRIADGGSAG